MLEVGSFLETTASQSLKHETQVPKSRKCRVISMHAIAPRDVADSRVNVVTGDTLTHRNTIVGCKMWILH